MSSSVLKNNTYWLLMKVSIAVKHMLMNIAEQYGLTVMQLYTLCLLESDKSIPMNSLSSTLYCDASNVTGIVDRLLAQEYIKREENPKDRREKMITLTSKGAKLCEKVSDLLLSSEPAALKNLSDQKKEELKQILTHIIDLPPTLK